MFPDGSCPTASSVTARLIVSSAEDFINELGNPYSYILDDKEGSLSVELGAYGVPETLVIDENKMIIKKIVGPIEQKLLNEIILNLK